jgi:hypothetical protein
LPSNFFEIGLESRAADVLATRPDATFQLNRDANREQSVVEVLDRAILFEREIKAPLPGWGECNFSL